MSGRKVSRLGRAAGRQQAPTPVAQAAQRHLQGMGSAASANCSTTQQRPPSVCPLPRRHTPLYSPPASRRARSAASTPESAPGCPAGTCPAVVWSGCNCHVRSAMPGKAECRKALVGSSSNRWQAGPAAPPGYGAAEQLLQQQGQARCTAPLGAAGVRPRPVVAAVVHHAMMQVVHACRGKQVAGATLQAPCSQAAALRHAAGQ